MGAIKKISQKVTRRHSKKEKKKESVVEKSTDAIAQMKGLSEMLIQSSTESASFDAVDGKSEKPKMSVKSSSMDVDTTKKKEFDDQKQRSSSVVSAISQMK